MLYVIVFLFLVISDQITKFLTVEKLNLFESYPIIEGILDFTRCHNTGGPWSIFDNHPYVFIIVTVLIFITGFLYIKKHPLKNILSKTAICLITGGAVGNFIDRVLRGYVVDMIDVNFFNYPVFNVADCYIVAGTILMCIYVLFIYKENE